MNLAGLLCILPMLSYLMGIRQDRGTVFVVKVYADDISLNAVTPCHCVSVGDTQRKFDKVSLSSYMHEELNVLK